MTTTSVFVPASGSTAVFLSRKRKNHIPVYVLNAASLKGFLSKQPTFAQAQIKAAGYEAAPEKALLITDEKGGVFCLLAGVGKAIGIYDLAGAADLASRTLSAKVLEETGFFLNFVNKPAAGDINRAYIGWGLAGYSFSHYKPKPPAKAALVWGKDADRAHVLSIVESIATVRNLINAPSNDMGPDELETAARAIAGEFKAKISTIHDQALLDKNFPLIYAVGQASPRRPRLIDLRWGDAKHPKVTLVGKGVCFDTGGLDIKPSSAMRYMKKDMGGAAHALALARLIMAHNLPVRLRVLIPAVENAVGGAAFRPGDIIRSRKGLSVENTNTDAEGRLVLADALAYASEDKPELIFDFATLTGSARAALGPDIPALFSNNDKIADAIKKAAFACGDPVWAMPLWQPYRKHIESSISDLINSAGLPGDLIYSALFLETFVESGIDWAHFDIFAWEHSGRPGRPQGGADTGLLATFIYLQARYA
ncbi:MAG: leucyl aminopeptidase family protein [Alphaproteobacteria bacterium]|nr:leucyl aminopeptidase family protein [Alphaproteobacteria bacterium]